MAKKIKTGKKASGGAIGRAKPMTAKAGVTKNGARRYNYGGKLGLK